MLAAALLLLSPARAAHDVGRIVGARIRTDFSREYRYGFGLRGGMGISMGGSSWAWSSGAQAGLSAELAMPMNWAWLGTVDVSWQALAGASQLFSGGTGRPVADESVRGAMTHRLLLTGFRFTPPLARRPGPVEPRPELAILLGMDRVSTRWQVGAPDGLAELGDLERLPAMSFGGGLLLLVAEHVSVHLGVGATGLFAFDQAEHGGGDHLRLTWRLSPLVEAGGRFR